MSNKTIVIGNSPYKNLNISQFIDNNIDTIVRCNLALPDGNTSSRYGKLALCSHIHNRFFVLPQGKQGEEKDEHWKSVIEEYKPNYKLEHLNTFIDRYAYNGEAEKFEDIYYEEPDTGAYNRKLESLGAPTFLQQPRTGHSAAMRRLLKGDKVFLFGFTVFEDEERVTDYVREGKYESECHNKQSEIKVINWLHNNGHIDASLCLLEDTQDIKFKNHPTISPSKFILNYFSRIIK